MTTAQMTVEEQILEWLDMFGTNESVRAARWIKAYGDIAIAYAEYTGGHISREALDRVLAEKCFAS